MTIAPLHHGMVEIPFREVDAISDRSFSIRYLPPLRWLLVLKFESLSSG